MRKIFDDRTDLGCFQRLALNLCAYRVQAGRRRGGRDRDIASGWFGGAAKGRFCHAELVWPDQIVSSVNSRVASRLFESRRRSTRLKPRNTSGRRAVDRREITTTFSRPVSRLTRRVLSCGRSEVAAFIAARTRIKRISNQSSAIAAERC